jgi:hypothetical protein
MAERVDASSRCRECLRVARLDVQVQHLAVFAFEKTIAGACVDMGKQIDPFPQRSSRPKAG